MLSVLCSIEKCSHNCDGECEMNSIAVGWADTNDFERGKRVRFPSCQDYEEVGDGDAV